jgi:hypothetical protein
VRGYGVMQPCISVTLESGARSRFARISDFHLNASFDEIINFRGEKRYRKTTQTDSLRYGCDKS